MRFARFVALAATLAAWLPACSEEAPPGVDADAPFDPAPAFELVDQDGQPLSLAEFRGKAVLLDFVFTRCPGPCPILTGTHVELQRSLAEDVAARTWLLSITVDPEHDAPDVLRAYAAKHGVDFRNWSFLTGPVEVVDAVVRSYAVGTVRGADGAIDHTVLTILIGPDGRILRYYTGSDHDAEELARDLRRALS